MPWSTSPPNFTDNRHRQLHNLFIKLSIKYIICFCLMSVHRPPSSSWMIITIIIQQCAQMNSCSQPIYYGWVLRDALIVFSLIKISRKSVEFCCCCWMDLGQRDPKQIIILELYFHIRIIMITRNGDDDGLTIYGLFVLTKWSIYVDCLQYRVKLMEEEVNLD